MRHYMPKSGDWVEIIKQRREALREAEDHYAGFLSVDPDNRRALVATIAEDLDTFEADGTLGDEDQDAAIEKVIVAMRALRKAEMDSKQGRLFPEGAPASRRSPYVSAEQIERAKAADERSRAEIRHMVETRKGLREAAERRARADREDAERALSTARRSRVMKTTSSGRYAWGGKTMTIKGWMEALVADEELRRALLVEANHAQMLERQRWEEESKAREAAARKEKAQAAKRPLPAGYVVEKGRGGYKITAPNGTFVARKVATKGEAVALAHEHHDKGRRTAGRSAGRASGRSLHGARG